MMPASLAEVTRHSRELLSEREISAAIVGLADRLSAQLNGKDVFCLVVLNGGMVFAGQLLTQLRATMQLDYVHVTRYGDGTSGKELHWVRDVPDSVAGRAVLVLDDIYDQGFTLEGIVSRCLEQGAEDVFTAVLVHKLHDRPRARLQPDFVGLSCEDLFIYGFGMDYQGYGRNLPAIYAIEGD